MSEKNKIIIIINEKYNSKKFKKVGYHFELSNISIGIVSWQLMVFKMAAKLSKIYHQNSKTKQNIKFDVNLKMSKSIKFIK